MTCLSPLILENPGITGTRYIQVPCGTCAGCLINKRNQMTFRAYQELKDHFYQAVFFTLTYNNENNPVILLKSDIQKFIKRIRKKHEIRYLICGEYGEITDRPHFHGIIYGLPNNEETALLIQNKWRKGYTSIGSATVASIHYICKYVMKSHIYEPGEHTGHRQNCYLISKNPIFGEKYIRDYAQWHKENPEITTASFQGYTICLPYNFRQKLCIKSKKQHIQRDDLALQHYAYQKNFERREKTIQKPPKEIEKLTLIKQNEDF